MLQYSINFIITLVLWSRWSRHYLRSGTGAGAESYIFNQDARMKKNSFLPPLRHFLCAIVHIWLELKPQNKGKQLRWSRKGIIFWLRNTELNNYRYHHSNWKSRPEPIRWQKRSSERPSPNIFRKTIVAHYQLEFCIEYCSCFNLCNSKKA